MAAVGNPARRRFDYVIGRSRTEVQINFQIRSNHDHPLARAKVFVAVLCGRARMGWSVEISCLYKVATPSNFADVLF